MEGLWKVWRQQKIVNNSPDLDYYGKPLPPPPMGWYWERHEDGSWELMHFDENMVRDNEVVLSAPAVIEHVIMPCDTMQGICLKYRVSAVTLRRFNNFSGNSFRSKKALRIPLEPGVPVSIQLPTHDVMIQQFKNITGEGHQESQFYLEDHGWDLREAVAAFNGDLAWIEDHKQHIRNAQSQPTAPSAPIMPPALLPAASAAAANTAALRRPIPVDGIELVAPHAIAYSMDELNSPAYIHSEEEAVRVPLLG
jgi:hypothetical protein